jgi:transposase-like protein
VPRPTMPALPATASRWTEADARLVLAEHARSGLSFASFAAHCGLDVQRLYRWRRALTAETRPTPVKFLEVRAPRGLASTPTIEIMLPGGVVLRVREDVDASAVARLVDALLGPERC